MAKRDKSAIKTDITKQYIIELCVIGEPYLTVPTICNVRAENGVIIANAAEDPELFETHRFHDEFFQWLMYRGKIKLYNNDVSNDEK